MPYLESKGHFPTKALSGGRLTYLCPLPWHAETKPSFIVWTNDDYENFYCFGCQAKHNIIHLVSFLENISAKQAIENLAEGFESTFADEERFLLEDPQKMEPTWEELDHTAEISQTLIEISDICYSFLKSTDYNEEESQRLDKLWCKVDQHLRDYEFDKIEAIRQTIGQFILERKNKLYLKEIADLHNQYKETSNDE